MKIFTYQKGYVLWDLLEVGLEIVHSGIIIVSKLTIKHVSSTETKIIYFK